MNNREIKFRVWDKDSEYMYYSDREDLGGVNGNDVIIWNITEVGISVLQNDIWHVIEGGEDVEKEGYREVNIELMQYTGLKDKEGKEIYEGDVLQWRTRDHEENPLNMYFVYWDNKNASFLIGDEKEIGYGTEILQWAEIIGNIYQNPELLK